MRRAAITTVLATTMLSVAIVPVAARPRHRRAVKPDIAASTAPAPAPFSFYPEDIDGGVKGNYSFNNQIRKFKDPLNANGGR